MKTAITIPVSVANDIKIKEAIKECTAFCGGCTVLQGRGSWVSSDGKLIEEGVMVYEFISADHLYSAVLDAVGSIRRRMFDAGERAVLIEVYSARGYLSHIYENKHNG